MYCPIRIAMGLGGRLDRISAACVNSVEAAEDTHRCVSNATQKSRSTRAELATPPSPATIPGPKFSTQNWRLSPMPRPESARERREKKEQFQSFNRPKLKITRTSASG